MALPAAAGTSSDALGSSSDDGSVDANPSTSAGTEGTGSMPMSSTGPAPGESSSSDASSDEGSSAGSEGSSDGSSTGDPGSTSTGAPALPDPVAHYEVTIINTWSERNHPGAVPEYAHFSWLGGATHDEDVVFWELGALASPGMVQMAEIGNTTILGTEVAAAIEAGHADASLQWEQWFCPPVTDVAVCGEDTVAFDVQLAFPRVTLVSMLGPSPDLFVGVSSLPLLAEGDWVDEIVIDLRPYDGGTRSDVDFTMNGALQEPPEPISAIESFADHMLGPASLGTMTLVRVMGP